MLDTLDNKCMQIRKNFMMQIRNNFIRQIETYMIYFLAISVFSNISSYMHALKSTNFINKNYIYKNIRIDTTSTELLKLIFKT